MVDPNDFTDKDTPEGEEEGNPKAGRFGVGGLSTEQAEESYQNAANQHFSDDVTHQEGSQDEKQEEENQETEEHVDTPPQIGSIEDDEISVD